MLSGALIGSSVAGDHGGGDHPRPRRRAAMAGDADAGAPTLRPHPVAGPLVLAGWRTVWLHWMLAECCTSVSKVAFILYPPKSWTPWDLDSHPQVRSYAFGIPRSTRIDSIKAASIEDDQC